MERTFIELNYFRQCWESLGLDDNALFSLEQHLLANPDAGSLMPGCGGARKIRMALPGRGKSSSTRVIYVDFIRQKQIYFLYVYPKSKQEKLTEEQKKFVRDIIKEIKEVL